MRKIIATVFGTAIVTLLTIPNPISAAPPLGSVVLDLLARVGILETNVATLQTDIDIAEASISSLEEQISTPDGGDSAFMFSNSASTYVLKMDGTVWRYSAPETWTEETEYASPVDISDILSWNYDRFLHSDGSLWYYYNNEWVSSTP